MLYETNQPYPGHYHSPIHTKCCSSQGIWRIQDGWTTPNPSMSPSRRMAHPSSPASSSLTAVSSRLRTTIPSTYIPLSLASSCALSRATTEAYGRWQLAKTPSSVVPQIARSVYGTFPLVDVHMSLVDTQVPFDVCPSSNRRWWTWSATASSRKRDGLNGLWLLLGAAIIHWECGLCPVPEILNSNVLALTRMKSIWPRSVWVLF